MGELPGAETLVDKLAYAIQKLDDSEKNNPLLVPAAILLKPSGDQDLIHRVEQTLVDLAITKRKDFSVDENRKQYLDYVAKYDGMIGILIYQNGVDAKLIKNRIIEEINLATRTKIYYSFTGFACYNEVNDTADKILLAAQANK